MLEFRRGRRAHHGIVHEVTPSVRHVVLLDVVTTDAKLRRLDAEDLGAGLTVLGTLRAAGRHTARSADDPRAPAELSLPVWCTASTHAPHLRRT